MKFIDFSILPREQVNINDKLVNIYSDISSNIDYDTVTSFGKEWNKFSTFSEDEINEIASSHYFDIVSNEYLIDKQILDVGCGSGRWSKYVSKLAKTVDAIDPSDSIYSAAFLLKDNENVRISKVSVDKLPFGDNSFDFVFSLGVLHHIPDTALALKQCVQKLKVGGYFLVYIYYNLDNRLPFYKILFTLSNLIRKLIIKMPAGLKDFICDIISVFIYVPLILTAKFLSKIGLTEFAHKMPLSFYINKTFNVVRNDSRDRFGTPLEQRFSKIEIEKMMVDAGLVSIIFSKKMVYWHAIGRKK